MARTSTTPHRGAGTRPPLDSSALVKELEGVAAKLGDGSSTGKDRLALLRRQAELGDVRDAVDERARRRLPERPTRSSDRG
jgi:hypothetical protein